VGALAMSSQQEQTVIPGRLYAISEVSPEQVPAGDAVHLKLLLGVTSKPHGDEGVGVRFRAHAIPEERVRIAANCNYESFECSTLRLAWQRPKSGRRGLGARFNYTAVVGIVEAETMQSTDRRSKNGQFKVDVNRHQTYVGGINHVFVILPTAA
jgi:hypothetical protein